MACDGAEQQTLIMDILIAFKKKKRSLPQRAQKIIAVAFALTLFFCLRAKLSLILTHTSAAYKA